MCSQQHLRNFLEQICIDGRFQLFDYESPEKFKVWIICRTEKDRDATYYNDYTKEWVNKFAKFTSTSWIVQRTFPNMKRLLYRKTYICHLAARNKKKCLTRNNSRNQDCRAKIDFKMKMINRNTIRNDKCLKEGLNLNIYIEFTHTHHVKTTESYNLLKCSSETNAIFYKYFSNGHSPTSAKCYHELLLLSKEGGVNNKDWSNRDLNPSIRHVFYLHTRKSYEERSIDDIIMEKIQNITEKGGAVMCRPDVYELRVIITAFMKNVLLSHELHHVIVDSRPIKDGFVTFFLVPTQVGALPIACALHIERNEVVLNHIFPLIKQFIENQVCKAFEPTMIMASESEDQLAALRLTFPNSNVYVSRNVMCEVIWRVLNNEYSKFDKQHELMLLFYSLLYANSSKDDKIYQELETHRAITTTHVLKDYLDKIWNHRELYLSQNDNKFLDTSLCILKEFILSRCSNFNCVIMIDVLGNILDKYWNQTLLTILQKKHNIMDSFTQYLAKDKTVMDTLLDIKVGKNEYSLVEFVGSGFKKRSKITFRSDTMCCDCDIGKKGRFCAHLNGFLQSSDLNIELSEEAREFYSKITIENVDYEFLKLEQDPTTPKASVSDDEQDFSDDSEPNEDNSMNNDTFDISIKEEFDDCDPLNDNMSETNSENVKSDNFDEINPNEPNIKIIINDMKNTYQNALKALNGEFKRLNKLFIENPSASNLDTMRSVTKELAKINGVTKVE